MTAKLSKEDVEEIFDLMLRRRELEEELSSLSMEQVARVYGVHRNTVWKIWNGEHVLSPYKDFEDGRGKLPRRRYLV